MGDQSVLDVARVNVDAFNDGDWDRFGEVLTEGSVYDEVATDRRVEGRDAILEVNREWKQAFPDARGTLQSEFASGDTVVEEITWEGTHSGPLASPQGDIPASNRRISVRAVQVIELEGDKIKATRHYFDLMGLLQQIGAVPEQTAA
jgi:steroid delta-isomerase-like uncharacterized protein